MRRVLLAALAACTVLGLGCSDDKKTTMPNPGPAYVARTSPENVLTNLVLAYESKDIEAYKEQLHDPDFVFVPNPGDSDINFTQLSYDDDVASTTNMFDQVDAIELTLMHGASTESDNASSYPAEEGYRKVQVTAVDLRVVTRGTSGDPLILVVNGDTATFVFKPDSTQSPVTYKIVLQQDGG